MNAKAWLLRAKRLDEEIEQLLETRDAEKARVTKITQTLSGSVVQSSKDPHKFDRLVELELEIDRAVDELIRTKAEVLSGIMKLEDGRHRKILRLRYIDGKTFEEIAVDIKYSWKQTRRLHAAALVKMEEVLNESTGHDTKP